VDLDVRENEYIAVMGHPGQAKYAYERAWMLRPGKRRGYELDGDNVTDCGFGVGEDTQRSGLVLCFSRLSFCPR